MKKRIITALIGLSILFVVLCFNHTIVLNIAIAVIAVLAVYEILHNTKYITDPALLIISLIYAVLMPFSHTKALEPYSELITMMFIVLLLIVLFRKHKTLPFQQVAICFTSTLLISYALSSIAFVRDVLGDDRQIGLGLYYIIFIFICAWVSDAGAYFIGRTFGKHKLAPTISPKKTIEGAIGGIVFCVIFNIAFTFVYFDILKNDKIVLEVNLLNLVILSFVASLIGIVGDLSASIIKRQTGLKDFGTIMPGHGGALDRFDSILFIAPFLFVMLQIFEITKPV